MCQDTNEEAQYLTSLMAQGYKSISYLQNVCLPSDINSICSHWVLLTALSDCENQKFWVSRGSLGGFQIIQKPHISDYRLNEELTWWCSTKNWLYIWQVFKSAEQTFPKLCILIFIQLGYFYLHRWRRHSICRMIRYLQNKIECFIFVHMFTALMITVARP